MRRRSFKLACDRKVEEIKVTSAYFSIPPWIFQCETLVNLELNISQRCMFPKLNSVNLPKLKLLSFSHEGKKPFDSIAMLILNRGSLIDFVTDPTELDTAYIDLTYLSFLRTRGMDANDFVREISKFAVQLSSVREFHLESNVKLFYYMHSVNSLPLFANLSYATATLTGSSGVIDFLLLLQIAPNLKEVFVTLNYDEGNPLAHMIQLVVVVPELLLNNLECVNIIGLQGNNDEVNLVGYILKNATVLNELWMGVFVDGVVEYENARVGKKFKYYKACFRLPIASTTIDKGCVLWSVPKSKQ
ncbi:hypothetical protein RDABS01_036651 [Bienertia sinuspersici]